MSTLSGVSTAPSSPTSTASFLYDGSGHRVQQQSVSSGTTTTTVYVGSLEAVTTSGATTTTTTYYAGAGHLLAEAVNGAFSFLATTAQGSVAAALSASGTTSAAQLYTPYGSVRYSSGTMPTDYGYTGQRADAATGLDFYQARYYDPAGAQFASADTVADGLNRYGYVGGNPTTATDPTGHYIYMGGDDGCIDPCASTTPTQPTGGGGGGTDGGGGGCTPSAVPTEAAARPHSMPRTT